MKLKIIGLMLTFLVSMSGSALAVDCTGTVNNLSLQLNSTGTVTLSLAGGPTMTYLCDVDGTANRNGVSPTVCKTMYSTLMAAKVSGKKVLIRFYDHESCSSVPAWDNAGSLGWTKLLLN